jgi:uncharacterized protein YcbX
MTLVGQVAALWRYPVKSMAGERLSAADISWHGIAGDRRWAFVRPEQSRNGFPWLTLRERPDLAHHRPGLSDPARPDASPVLVRTPDGRELDVADPALAASLGAGVRAMKQDRGVFDALPLSLLTTRSLSSLGRLAGRRLAPERFRPNLLIEPVAGDDFPEEAWLGQTLRIGDAALRIDARDGRCAVITIDPESLERDRGVLRAVARERANRLGVYASTVRPARVTIGAPVEL